MKRLVYTEQPPTRNCFHFAHRLVPLVEMDPVEVLRMAQKIFAGQATLHSPIIFKTPSATSGAQIDQLCREFGILCRSSE